MLLQRPELYSSFETHASANELNLLLAPEIIEMKDVYHLPDRMRYDFLHVMNAATFSNYRNGMLEKLGVEKKLNMQARNFSIELSVTIERKHTKN
ncbi:MAG TPA: hypothetical protein VJJ76_03750 [archaeon]|nr:hypothetical protein [archaeon]